MDFGNKLSNSFGNKLSMEIYKICEFRSMSIDNDIVYGKNFY